MENTQRQEDLLALKKIEESSTKLQEQGNYLEALECMERGLVLRQHFFGPDSEEVWSSCKIVGEMCNALAMTYLEKDNFSVALELLKKAEILTERDPASATVTFNNLACYYRRQGKLRSALQYLQKALKIEDRLGDAVRNPADTYLNTCAVLSQLGRHQSALEHAQSALILLHEKNFRGTEIFNNGDESAGNYSVPLDRVAVLSIAYYNIGAEQEFLKKVDASITSYQKGLNIAQRYLGEDHSVAVTLRNAYKSACKLSKRDVPQDKKERYNTKETIRRMKRNMKAKNKI